MNPRNRRQRLSNIQQIAEDLRHSADSAPAPDFTRSILDRVDAERPFLTQKTRHLVIAARFGAGLAAVLAVGAVVVFHRMAPGALELSPAPAPLSTVVESVKSEATVQLADLRSTVQNVALSAQDATPELTSNMLLTLVAASPARVEKAAQASPEPLIPSAACCQMVGPTLPPDEAARLGCCSSRTEHAVVCLARPLADAARYSCGTMPSQSPWKFAASRVMMSSDFRPGAGFDEVLPLFSGPGLDGVTTPR